MNKKIVLIDYEVGNTHSIQNALQLLGYRTRVSRQEGDILGADALILPGVGSFGEAMGNLYHFGLTDILHKAVIEQGKPIIGICLGMQILTHSSEEDESHKGLGWIPGSVKKIQSATLRVPHVGWNNLNIYQSKPLFEKHGDDAHYYFDHSFHFTCDEKYIAATCNYERELVAAVKYNNIYGVQFHPEKSHVNGLKLFRSFFNHLEF